MAPVVIMGVPSLWGSVKWGLVPGAIRAFCEARQHLADETVVDQPWDVRMRRARDGMEPIMRAVNPGVPEPVLGALLDQLAGLVAGPRPEARPGGGDQR